MYDNKLYIWECKVFYRKKASGNKIAEAVYKISSVSQSLGLQATSFVTILTPFGSNKMRRSFLEDISRLMRVKKVFSLEDMKDKRMFAEQIRGFLV